MTIHLSKAVEDFWTARARGEFFPRAYFDRLTLDEAYRIQLALIERRCAEGECHIGWKVGLTAKAIQEQFGFFEPVFGCILETRPSGHVFGATELINPGWPQLSRHPSNQLRRFPDLSACPRTDPLRVRVSQACP